MFISYAQNFEDVILWRALKGIKNGFYIDVGAQDPINDSVSFAFYQHGWRGVHVEPVHEFAQRIRVIRPDEETIEAALGTASGEIAFYKVGDTGMSTGDSAIAAQHRSAGLSIELTSSPCIRLSDVLSRFADRDIHWLKIDVEGMEKDVIDSWLPSDVRPWIVIVESTRPNSREENFSQWEPTLVALGYGFKYFDGLNRYYVSTSHKELESAFGLGPNYFDDFSVARNSPFSRLLSSELNTLDEEIAGLRRVAGIELDAANCELEAARNKASALEAEISDLRGAARIELDAANVELEAARNKASAREAEISDLRGATRMELEAANRELEAARHETHSLGAEISGLRLIAQTELDAANRKRADVEVELREIAIDAEASRAEVALLRESTSWKITAPLRAAKVFAVPLQQGVRAWVTLAPGSRPHRVGRKLIANIAKRLARSPSLKRAVVFLLRPFPDLSSRLRIVMRSRLLRDLLISRGHAGSASSSDTVYSIAALKNGEALALVQLRTLYVFVDHTVACSVNTGVQRTVRGLSNGLRQFGSRVRYVKWDDATAQCVLINLQEREYLAAWNGPELSAEERNVYRPAGEPVVSIERAADGTDSWLLVPEVPHITFHPRPVTLSLILWARRSNLKAGFVFYDAIPLRRDEFRSMAAPHAEYMGHLRLADAVWPISKWSADDLVAFWTKSDRANSRTMPRLVSLPLPGAADLGGRVTEPGGQEKLILCVGTIEPRKNQLRLIEAFEDHRRDNPDSSWRLILVGNLHPLVADAVNRALAGDSHIQHLGHASDEELNSYYRACAFTVFPSEDEGFGLPILESLWHGKPCICANFGAMGEVAAGGGCLAIDTRDPAALRRSIESLMADADLQQILSREAIQRPISTWADYAAKVFEQADGCVQAKLSLGRIYFWVDSTLTFPKNTGIQRVTRQLARHLLDLGYRLTPVRWDRQTRRFAPVDRAGLEHLARWNGPRPDQWSGWTEPGGAEPNSWFMMTELPLDLASEERRDLVQFAREMKLRCCAVFYDAIPWKMRGIYPEFYSEHVSLAHKDYMIGLDRYDLVLPISEFSANDLVNFLGTELARPLGLEARVRAVSLSGEFAESPRINEVSRPPGEGGTITVLCVGTVEPRKNHLKLLAAFAKASARSVVPIRLIIVGRRTEPNLADEVESYTGRYSSISWEEDADDARLRELHLHCDFTVYPSVEEGFGLPILESLWYAKPCICADCGAMAEVAAGGGCIMVDVRDPEALASAIQGLAEDGLRVAQLSREAIARPFKPWRSYASEVAMRLADASRTASAGELALATGEIERRASAMRIAARPQLSVCISTYNRAEWLSASLKNWARLYPKPVAGVELFVCDNASSDHTAEIVKPYFDREDFAYRRNSNNVGMLGNLRETAQHARGDHIWILGDDDLLMSGAIERVLRAIEENPGTALVYLNYAFTRIEDARTISDFDAFFRDATPIVPAEPDRVGPIKLICARNENFFTAIYTLVLRRDHAIGAYSQDTSGRPFSTMLTCIPTTHHVLKNMMEEQGVWIGTPQVVVNMNVSWMKYAPLWILERIPEVYDEAELNGVATADIDRWRHHTLPGVVHYFYEIFLADPLNNAAYFSPARLFRRLKHLPEFVAALPELRAVYRKAHAAGHPSAVAPVEAVFPESAR